jgi:hypothetical protein
MLGVEPGLVLAGVQPGLACSHPRLMCCLALPVQGSPLRSTPNQTGQRLRSPDWNHVAPSLTLPAVTA